MMKMLDIRNIWSWLAAVVVACGLYAANTEIREHRVETVMRQREKIASQWPSEEVYVKELEPISIDYCPSEFKEAWREYLQVLRKDATPEGQARKALDLAHGQTRDPVQESLNNLVWTARGYGFIPKELHR